MDERLDEIIGEPPDWMKDALCTEPDYAPYAGHWFAEERRGQLPHVAYAKSVCAQCLVRNECLDYALEGRIDYGVCGAASARERRMMAHTPNSWDPAGVLAV